MNSQTDYCSQLALDERVPLMGTSSEADIWILLEYRGAWRANATDDNDLPPATQAWLQKQTATLKNSRVVFVRRDVQRQSLHELCCYIAVTREQDQRLYRLTFVDYGELAEIDVARVIESSLPQCDEKLVLVCTNGKRDRCCAVFGRPVYDAFADKDQLSVWQATHLGGHRYAAVAAVFPAGIYYGYLRPDTVSAVAERICNDTIHLPSYRGRVYYSGVVSAADYFLRQATGVQDVGLISAEINPDDHHLIEFESPNSRHHVMLEATVSEPALVGCTANKFKPQPVYKLRQIVHVQKSGFPPSRE